MEHCSETTTNDNGPKSPKAVPPLSPPCYPCYQKREAAAWSPSLKLNLDESNVYTWQEHFVDIDKACATAKVGAAVAQSLSYVTIPNFGRLEERAALQNSVSMYQEEAEEEQDCPSIGQQGGEDHHHHVMGASQVNFNCSRYSVERLLDVPAKAVSSTFLNRLLNFLQNDTNLMGIFDECNYTIPLTELQVTWYSEPDDLGILHPEPKVNIYQQGGYFKTHGWDAANTTGCIERPI